MLATVKTTRAPRLTIFAERLQRLLLGKHKITDDWTSRVHPNPFRDDQVPDVALVRMDVDQPEIPRDLHTTTD
jgi:hypothetical protein